MHYPQLYKTRTLFVSSNPREKNYFGCKTRIKKMLKQLGSWTEKGPSNLQFFFFFLFFFFYVWIQKKVHLSFSILIAYQSRIFFFCIVQYLILLKAQNNKLWFNFIIKSANMFIISIYVNILNDVYCHIIKDSFTTVYTEHNHPRDK